MFSSTLVLTFSYIRSLYTFYLNWNWYGLNMVAQCSNESISSSLLHLVDVISVWPAHIKWQFSESLWFIDTHTSRPGIHNPLRDRKWCHVEDMNWNLKAHPGLSRDSKDRAYGNGSTKYPSEYKSYFSSKNENINWNTYVAIYIYTYTQVL